MLQCWVAGALELPRARCGLEIVLSYFARNFPVYETKLLKHGIFRGCRKRIVELLNTLAEIRVGNSLGTIKERSETNRL